MSRFNRKEYYVNRELSWLMFDERVLGEATDTSNYLMERLKFLSITASNLDEFFMVRVASLIDMQHANYNKRDIAGLTTDEQLSLIAAKTHELVDTQYFVLMHTLLPLMKAEGINLITKHEDLTKEQAEFVDKYFEEEVYPVLTPMAVDSSRATATIMFERSLSAISGFLTIPSMEWQQIKPSPMAERQPMPTAMAAAIAHKPALIISFPPYELLVLTLSFDH